MHYEGGSPGFIFKAVHNVSVAPNFTFMFVPTIPMVNKPFDINLEENVHDVLAVEVSDASAPNEVNRRSLTILSRKVTQEGKVQKCKANKHSTHQHDRIQSISENSDEHSSHISEHICYSTVRLQSISENSDELSSHISEHICYSTEARKAC